MSDQGHGVCLHCALTMMLQGAITQGKEPFQAAGEIIQVLAELIASQPSSLDRLEASTKVRALLERETARAVAAFKAAGKYGTAVDDGAVG